MKHQLPDDDVKRIRWSEAVYLPTPNIDSKRAVYLPVPKIDPERAVYLPTPDIKQMLEGNKVE